MTYVISVKNDTTYTPLVQNIQLTNCEWYQPVVINDGQPIATYKQAVGMLAVLATPASLKLRVHYCYLAPGPDGGNVDIEFRFDTLNDKPLTGFECTAIHDRLVCEFDVGRKDDDLFLIATISTKAQA